MTSPILQATDLSLGYGGVPVVSDFNLTVSPGEVVAIVGANGAGKTTTLLGLAGAIQAISGAVTFDGIDQNSGLSANARRGMGLLTDDRSIFKSLTTWENLRLGGGTPEDAVQVFPALERLRRRKAGLLSGGEQQMLGLARVIARRPKLLLADELSLGLAPIIVRSLFDSVRRLADERGTAVVIVEQHVRLVLQMADTALVLDRGRVVYSGSAAALRDDEERITRAYLSDAHENDVPTPQLGWSANIDS